MTSLWLNEAAPIERGGAVPEAVDVAVIGGGIAGVSTAFHTSERGASVALLERCTIASRASGRNDGHKATTENLLCRLLQITGDLRCIAKQRIPGNQ